MTDHPGPGPSPSLDPDSTRPDLGTGRRRLLTAGVAAGAVLAGLGVAWWQQRGTPAINPAAGAEGAQGATATALDHLWSLSLVRPEGGELALATLRGKPLLINFWATWCPPCLRELPEIDRFHREFGPRGWQVLGLAIDGPTPVREFLARVKIGFPTVLAGMEGTELVNHLGNPQGGLPFSVMIDAAGQVRQRKLGETDFDELAGWAAKG
jgi:thiol-disulfide isomerase/thioredoxin